jgi:CubicO group peptidase (beta-lactamase class C family)
VKIYILYNQEQAMIYRFIISLTLVFSMFTLSVPQIGYAQTTASQTAFDFSKQLAEIEAKVEKRRVELGIPGMSLVIVKDGKIIFNKGLGYKDFEKKIPVTPDTQFGIGSATKAFTALSVLMSADEGKVDLDDSPKKYLPYFKMKDPETDKNMTVRDLMDHSSGLNRTDLAMITGKLNRQQLIQVVGEAKPMAKLNEKFFYNNIMFAAAGEITAKTNNMPWEKYVPARIFAPLGMTNSTMSIADMLKAKDYSLGYEYNFDTKETRKLPYRPIDDVAPAGSINSSANDMAKWIKFVMNGGTVGNKRLISEKNYEEWTKPQNKVTPNGKVNYGLGWFLDERNGTKIVQHGGNIDGFNSMVAMIPEKKIGFVMLTNVTGSSLGDELQKIIFEEFSDKPETPKADTSTTASPEKEVGKYNFAEAGFDVEVKIKDGKLFADVPGQPTYTLENIGRRKYKLKEVEGFFATFKDDSLFLEQPQGNFTLPKVGAKPAVTTPAGNSAKELIGKYATPDNKGTVEIKEDSGKITFNIAGQQPYALAEKSKDNFSLNPLPSDYSLKVKRTADGKIEGVAINQPEGEFLFKLIDNKTVADSKPKISVDEVMQKTVEALGGESAMRKITSRITKMSVDFENQGLKGTGITYEKAPNLATNDTVINSFGKTIGTVHSYFDGTNGGSETSFLPSSTLTGKSLENAKLNNDFYEFLNWKNGLKKFEITGTEKVGDEDCYVVLLEPEKASEIKYWISTKTFLPLKQLTLEVDSTSQQTTPSVATFSDYRAVDGVKMPFKVVVADQGMGNIVFITTEVKQNVKIDNGLFKAKSK